MGLRGSEQGQVAYSRQSRNESSVLIRDGSFLDRLLCHLLKKVFCSKP